MWFLLWSSTCEQEPHLHPLPIPWEASYSLCYEFDLWTRTTFESTANPLGSLIFIVVMKLDLWTRTTFESTANPLGSLIFKCFMKLDLWTRTTFESTANPLGSLIFKCGYEARPVNKNHICFHCQSLGKPHIHCFMKLDLWTRTTFASTANPLGSLIFIVLWSSTCEQEPHLNPLPFPWEASWIHCGYEARPVNKNHIWIHCPWDCLIFIVLMKLDLWTRTTFESTANPLGSLIFIVLWSSTFKNHICIHCQSIGKPHIHCVMKLDLWTRTTFESTANPLGSLIFIVLWSSTCDNNDCQSLGKPHIHCVMKLDLWTRTTFASTANPLGRLIFIVLWRSTCEQEPHLHPLPIPWEASYSLFYSRSTCEQEPHLNPLPIPWEASYSLWLWRSTCEQEPHLNPLPIPREASYSLCYEARPVNKNHIWSTANPLGSLIFIVLWSSTCEQEPHLHPLPIPWEASYSLIYEGRPVNKNHIWIHCQSLGKPHIHCVMKLDLWTTTTANPLGSLYIFIVLWSSTCEQEPHLHPLPIPWEASYSLFYEGRPVNKNHIWIHCHSLGKPHIHCFMNLDLWTRTTFASTANPLGSLIFIVLWRSTCEQEPHLNPLPIPWEASYSLFYEGRPVNKNHIWIHCQSLGKPHIHCFMKLDLWTRTTFASTANPLGSLIFIVLWSSTCEQEPHLHPLPIPWEASYSLFYEGRPVNKNHICIHCQSIGKPHIYCVMKLDLWTRTTFESTANPLGSLIFIVLWRSTCEQEPHLHPLPIPWEASYSLFYEGRPVNKNHIWIHCQSLGKPHILFLTGRPVNKNHIWIHWGFPRDCLMDSLFYEARPVNKNHICIHCQSLGKPHIHSCIKVELWTRTTWIWGFPRDWQWIKCGFVHRSSCHKTTNMRLLPIPLEASYSLFYEARPVNKNHIWIHCHSLGKAVDSNVVIVHSSSFNKNTFESTEASLGIGPSGFIVVLVHRSTCEQEQFEYEAIPWEGSYSLCYEARPVNKNHIWIHCHSLGKPHIHCVMKLNLQMFLFTGWAHEQEPHLNPLPIPWEASYSLVLKVELWTHMNMRLPQGIGSGWNACSLSFINNEYEASQGIGSGFKCSCSQVELHEQWIWGFPRDGSGFKCGSCSQVELHNTMNMRLPKGMAVDSNVVLVHSSSFITQWIWGFPRDWQWIQMWFLFTGWAS